MPGSASRSRSRSAATTGGAFTEDRLGAKHWKPPAGGWASNRCCRRALAMRSRSSSTERRRCRRSRRRCGSRPRTFTSRAGTSRPTSRSHATASPSCCAICSVSWRIASTSASSCGQAPPCHYSVRREERCGKCAIVLWPARRSNVHSTRRNGRCTATTRRRSSWTTAWRSLAASTSPTSLATATTRTTTRRVRMSAGTTRAPASRAPRSPTSRSISACAGTR